MKTQRFYVGSTGNVQDRVSRHNGGRSKATKSGVPWKLVYTKGFHTRSEAVQYERFIKSQKSKTFIQCLIKNYPRGCSSVG